MNRAICDPAELQNVADALNQDRNNFGVGIVEIQTGRVHLVPYDVTDAYSYNNPQLQVMAGHEAAAAMAGVPEDQARGFILAKQHDRWHVFNSSHLNAPDGQTNLMQMESQIFAKIINALADVGVQNPVLH